MKSQPAWRTGAGSSTSTSVITPATASHGSTSNGEAAADLRLRIDNGDTGITDELYPSRIRLAYRRA